VRRLVHPVRQPRGAVRAAPPRGHASRAADGDGQPVAGAVHRHRRGVGPVPVDGQPRAGRERRRSGHTTHEPDDPGVRDGRAVRRDDRGGDPGDAGRRRRCRGAGARRSGSKCGSDERSPSSPCARRSRRPDVRTPPR
jgi:hypothetical protein